MRSRRFWVALAVVLVVVVAILIAGHSTLLRLAVIGQLQAVTGRSVAIDALALDLFTGHIALRGFRVIDHDGGVLADIDRLDTRVRWGPLLRGHVRLDHLTIDKSTVRVVRFSNHDFNLSDIIRRKGPKTAPPLDVTIDRFTLRGGTVTLEDRVLTPWQTWHSEDLTIDAHDVSTTRGGGGGVATSRLEGAPISVTVKDLRLVPVHLAADVEIQGMDVALARLYLPPDTPITLQRGRLDATVTVVNDAKEGAQLDADVRLADVAVLRAYAREPVAIAPALRVRVAGLKLKEGAFSLARLDLDGGGTVQDTRVSPPARFDLTRVQLTAEALSWPVTGPAKVMFTSTVPGGGELSAQANVRVESREADARVKLTGLALAPWAHYVSSKARVAGTAEADFNVLLATQPELAATASGRAVIRSLAVSESDRRLATADRIELSRVRLQWPLTVGVETIRVVRPSVLVERDAAGEFTFKAAFARPIPEGVAADDLDVAPPPPKPWAGQVKIDELVVEDGRLAWNDAAGGRSTRLSVGPISGSVRAVAYPFTQPAVVDVSAQPPGGGRVQVTGRVGVAPMTTEVRIRAQSVDVSPYQAYVPLTVRLAGRADADLAVVMAPAPADTKVTGQAGLVRGAVNDGRRSILTVERANASGIDVAWPRRIAAKQVTIRRPWVLVERDRSGSFPLRTLLTAREAPAATPGSPATASGAPAAPPPPSDSEGLAVSLGQVMIADGAMRFIDETVSPAYAEEVRALTVQAQGVGTVDAPPAKVNLTARVGPAAPLAIRGTVGPLGGPLRVDLDVDLKDFNVPRVNPYLQRYVSWVAREGRFSATVQCRVKGGELEVHNDLDLARLALVRAGTDDEAQKRVGLPLGLIVSLMKNRKGEIRLSLPIGGTLTDPRFEVRDAIWSAVRAAAINTVTLPIGWIGRLKFSADSRIEDIAVDPADFTPGRLELTAEGQGQVDKVAKFMTEKPDVKMVLTPLVTIGDIDTLKQLAIRAQIEALAKTSRVSIEEAAARLFRDRVPGREPPATMDEIVQVIGQDTEPPAREATQLATDRVATVRDALKKAGVDSDRLAVNKDAEALESPEGGRVEFGLTDQLRPKRGLLAMLLQKLEAMVARLRSPSASPGTR